jgi:uncharacterized RDD family membrane protein YckC
MSSSLLGRTIGANIVNPVLQHIDIDELIVQRVDWNAVLERIDIDRVIERIDVDALIDRVDLDRVLKKVDVADLVRRSNLDAIIHQSTTSVLSSIFDLVRVQLIRFDQVIHSLCCCCACPSLRSTKKLYRKTSSASSRWRAVHQLPAKPGASIDNDAHWPTRATEWAVIMQGRHAGMVSRSLAYLCDRAIQTALFALGVWLLVASTDILLGQEWYKNSKFLKKHQTILVALCYFGFVVFYETVSIAFVGRTIGKSIFGLLIIKKQGRPISIGQALVRAILLTPIPWVMISAWLGVLRRDRRAVHDLVVGTCVIYNWDARRFQIREAAVTDSQRQQDPMLHDYSTV